MSISLSKYGALSGGARIPAFLAGLGTRDLRIFPVPGVNVFLAKGFDPYAKGLTMAPTPRHANILLVATPLSEALKKAAAVTFAQMPRPRMLVLVGIEGAGPLPEPNLVLRWSDINSLPSLVKKLDPNTGKVEAFAPTFLIKALEEKSEDGNGNDHDHMDMGEGKDGGDEKMQHGDDKSEEKEHKKMQDGHNHGDMNHKNQGKKKEVEDNGSAEDDGMDDEMNMDMNHQDQGEKNEEGENGLGEDEGMDDEMNMDGDMDMDHDDGGMDFMSMVMMTKGKPAGKDGLVMDRNEVHFGPFHPGLPDGLSIKMILDGDTVVHAEVDTALTGTDQIQQFPKDPLKLPDFFEKIAFLQPKAYKTLAIHALHDACGIQMGNTDPSSLERERILNHLLGIATLQQTLGDRDMHFRVSRTILDFQNQNLSREKLVKLLKKIKNRWYLKNRLKPLAIIPENLLHHCSGPVAKAAGNNSDLRVENPIYGHFKPISLQENNAWGHLMVLLGEIEQSFDLMEGFKDQKFDAKPDLKSLVFKEKQSGTAAIETANGTAHLEIGIDQGKVKTVKLTAPSKPLAALAPTLTQGLELGDGLVSMASLQIALYELNLDPS